MSMVAHSLLRQAEHKALSTVTLNGSVLDLGGGKDAEYLSYIKGTFSVTTLNLDEDTRPDIFHDLETPLPIPDASYDHVLLINVLEHIYDYRQLLSEAARVVRPGGKIVIIVPFLFPVHPSPRDFWRFTDEALRRECEALSLSDITISPLGRGVFSAQFLFIDRLLPRPLRIIGFYIKRPLIYLADYLFARLARFLGKKYSPNEYALGYLAVGTR